MGARMRAFDWSTTPLGRVETWPQGLRSAVSICLGSRFPIAIYWGPQLTLLYNDAWSLIPGTKHPSALGRGARDVWPEIWDTIGPMFEQVMSTGEATFSEDALLPMHRHGYTEECYFDFTFTPIRGEGARVEGVFNAVIETTFRVLSERRSRALRDLAERMAPARSGDEVCDLAAQALGDAIHDVPFCTLYLLGDDGRTAKLAGCAGIRRDSPWTPAAILVGANETPWPLAYVLGSKRMVVVDGLDERGDSPTRCNGWPEQVRAAFVVPMLTGGKAVGFAIFGANPRRTIDEEYREFAERAGSVIAAVVGNANAYQASRERAEQLAQIDRAKTAFFSNVSHEFRTPLTLMLGPQEDALRSPSGALAGEDLRAVHRNTSRLLELVNSLLDFSRMEAGRMEASYEQVDLTTLTQDLASSFRSTIERAGLEFDVDCPQLSAPVHVDRDMWEKIVLNLLSNAFKFTFEGSIRVSLREDSDAVQLEVRDTGVGIPERELPRLFERFHRIHGARSRTHEGSGIGLALVRDLVALHGGTVDVESEVDRGTSFIVSIPLGMVHLPADRIGASSTVDSAHTGTQLFVQEALRWLDTAAPEPTSEPATDGSSSARILVVDDNADMREYITRLLRPRWAVTAVSDGERALELARRAPPDLILSDVMMPNLDGFGLLEALRSDEATKTIPVILLSARAGEEPRVDGLEAGADDYLIKPFGARELLARVNTHLNLARARDEGARQWRRLLSLLDQVPTPISLVRMPERRYEFTNRAHVESTGRSVVGETLQEAFPELAEQGVWESFDHIVATKQAFVRREHPALRRWGDGTQGTRYFTTVMQPWLDDDGNVASVLSLNIDVTEQVLARQAAESASRAKDEFLAMLGHELRNPLSPMLTASQLMRMRGLGGRELSIIERQVAHLRRLVDDLLDVSRIAQGKVELRKQRLELANVVLAGIDMASPLLENRRQELDLDIPAEGLTIDADADRMAQVVSNLLTNAAKYSEPGTKIHISASRAGRSVRLSVRDHGIGIAPEMQARIFDSFVQQPQSLDRAKGGLGLGLSIVRSLMQLHGGTVEAHSEGVGKGSEFVIELPLSAHTGAPEDVRDEAGAGYGVSFGQPGRKRVLVVDDNVDAADTLAELLEAIGYATATAHDGPTALNIARTFRPDICLLDIGLPVMDGFEVAAKLREVEGLPEDLRIIAVTGYGQDSDRKRSRAAGFDAHVVKPVDLDLLLHSVVAN